MADLQFLAGAHVPECAHHIDKHFAGYQTLQYMTAGTVDLRHGNDTFVLNGRWFWSAYPGPRVAFHAGGGTKIWNHRYIAFTGSLVGRWTADGIFPIAPQPAPKLADLDARFDALLEHSRSTGRLDQLRAVHLIEGILLDLARHRSARPAAEAWVARAMTRLTESEVDCPTLASELGISESTFRRRFAQSTGTSPVEFRILRRIGNARQLLSDTPDAIKTIARQLGYRDVFFFTRQFTQRVGVSPAVYRKTRQG